MFSMKECDKCRVLIDEKEFSLRKDSGKLRNQCKKCVVSKTNKWIKENGFRRKEYRKFKYHSNREQNIKKSVDWAKNNPELRQKYCRSWRWRLRIEIIFEYGGFCACCGEEQPEFLTIDHINNDGGKMRKDGKQVVGGSFYRWLKKNNFPKDEFQLLCMNCNFAKGHFGGCPHNDCVNKEVLKCKEMKNKIYDKTDGLLEDLGLLKKD